MSQSLTVSLAISDPQRSFRFYRDGLGLDPVGDLAPDGMPEPLQFRLPGETYLCLIPTGGFGWVLGDRAIAAPDTSECLLGLSGASTRA